MQSLKDLVGLRSYYCIGKVIKRYIPPFKIVKEYVRAVYPDQMTKEAILSVARQLQINYAEWGLKTFSPGPGHVRGNDIDDRCDDVLQNSGSTPRQEERRKRRANKKKRREAGRRRAIQVTIRKKERWRKNKH